MNDLFSHPQITCNRKPNLCTRKNEITDMQSVEINTCEKREQML